MSKVTSRSTYVEESKISTSAHVVSPEEERQEFHQKRYRYYEIHTKFILVTLRTVV